MQGMYVTSSGEQLKHTHTNYQKLGGIEPTNPTYKTHKQHVSHKNLQTNRRYEEIWEQRFASHTDSQHKLLGSRVKLYVKKWRNGHGVFYYPCQYKRVKYGGNNQNLKLFLRGKHCYVRVYMSIVQRLSKVNVCFLITYR